MSSSRKRANTHTHTHTHTHTRTPADECAGTHTRTEKTSVRHNVSCWTQTSVSFDVIHVFVNCLLSQLTAKVFSKYENKDVISRFATWRVSGDLHLSSSLSDYKQYAKHNIMCVDVKLLNVVTIKSQTKQTKTKKRLLTIKVSFENKAVNCEGRR